MQHADRAMYRAKQNGRDGYQLFSDKDGESRSGVLERLQFESSIRHALERNQYVVYFQPQITLDRKRLVGMEAFVRWQHPELGLIPPGRFMPLLESSGLIKGVGEWVLRTACRQVKEWQDYMFRDLRISVNLSARQFEGSDLVASVERALAESGLPPTHLELEITESLLMNRRDDSDGLEPRIPSSFETPYGCRSGSGWSSSLRPPPRGTAPLPHPAFL